MTPASWEEAVERALAPLADPVRAEGARAYMRDQFPYLGIATPDRRGAIAALLRQKTELLDATRRMWRRPEREYRYCALDLLARQHKALSLADIEPLLEIIQIEPWWDTVDALAPTIAKIVKAAGDQSAMDRALMHSSLWVRRIAMIHQNGWRLATDRDRLFRYAEHLAPEKDFFARKAIGWALRDYARWAPDAVREFVMARKAMFSPLTVREAMKHL